MKKTLLFILLTFTLVQFLSAQSVYKNGSFGTGNKAKNGTKAPDGFQWSELQNDAGNTSQTNYTFGFSAYFSSSFEVSYSIADDFSVPEGEQWDVNSVSVYAYQTDRNGSTSPFNGLFVRIWKGFPNSEQSEVVFGDLTTNRLSEAIDSATYRITNTAFGGAADTRRRIWKLTADITGVSLEAGEYWLEWQTVASNDNPNFCPPVTVPGKRGLDGWNGIQKDNNSGGWNLVLDLGGPDTLAAPNIPQDFPFEISYENILPVTFLNFTGVVKNGEGWLNWSTATENNNKGFYVERSKDGQNFSSIGFVNGAGTSSQVKNYTYTDITLKDFITSTAYYRLKQVDMDGRITYSKVLPLSLKDIVQWKLYPNPVKNKATIELSLATAAKVSLQVVSHDGRILMNIDKGILAEGYQVFSINTQTLAAGSYIVRVVAGDRVFTQSLVKE